MAQSIPHVTISSSEVGTMTIMLLAQCCRTRRGTTINLEVGSGDRDRVDVRAWLDVAPRRVDHADRSELLLVFEVLSLWERSGEFFGTFGCVSLGEDFIPRRKEFG